MPKIVNESAPVEPSATSALSRGIQVLQCFTTADQAISSNEIIERTGLPRPTVFRITATLRQLGLIHYDERRATFTLGVRMLALAAPVLSRLTLRKLARPSMQQLADHAKCEIILAIGTDRDLVVVESVQSPDSAIYRLDLGTRLSVAHSVTGRVYLLTAAAAQREAFLERMGASSGDMRAVLEAQLQATAHSLRKTGYAVDHSESLPEVHVVAVPLRRPIDAETVVVSCMVPVYAATAAHIHDVGLRLVNLASNLESSLGRLGETDYDDLVVHTRPGSLINQSGA